MAGVEIEPEAGQDPSGDPGDAISVEEDGGAMRATIDESALDESNQDDQQEGSDRPDWLPEKFESPEDMAQAYSELEQKQSQGESSADDDADDDDVSLEIEPDDSAEDVADKAGLDWESIQDEYAENGELSDESYEAFEEIGLPQDAVDAMFEGFESRGAQVRDAIFDAVGGEEAFQDMQKWAQANMSAEELAAYNEAVQSGNVEQAKLAARGLKAAYIDANGQAPDLQRGGAETVPAEQGAKPFGSWEAVSRAMADPKYDADPAYRAEVHRRIGASDL